ncbi:TPA: hypothetical protein DEG21_01925 [Patescibacteria group bacterium]|nr:hypothetical protein [Candidatus Gracilibacteria bacterium]HBY74644.1 hypothetical protein [Candidatus Gracilibacteria bacterium]
MLIFCLTKIRKFLKNKYTKVNLFLSGKKMRKNHGFTVVEMVIAMTI